MSHVCIKSYEEFEKTQQFSPVSPEAYYAEAAWNAAVLLACKICMEMRPEGAAESEDYSVATVDCYEEISKLLTGFEAK